MLATTDTGFIEMRITKVVGFGPPLAEDYFWCVVLDGLSGDSHLVIEIGETESISLGATLQRWQFARPMTYQLTAALIRSLGGHLRQVTGPVSAETV
jgi:bifunctional DNase/RNase